jgi:hypothetical protein
MFKRDAANTVNALAISITNPLDGVILVKSSPTVLITRRPNIHRPSDIPTPPYNRIHTGVSALSSI